ncbi:hypothetical protein [Pseudomonas sp. Leaf58]|uniref:hypothetical protein n=1 Tax=Pseudomonas sp. Leaf58 TaxID=1736226 RepID=UPI0006FBC2C3|nr:hypothetical protein [Pseudomonas sp. Leaf58]KQN61650.1 hypothetical protein ASF02_14900 [Pseudomonas sp. Leaf58]
MQPGICRHALAAADSGAAEAISVSPMIKATDSGTQYAKKLCIFITNPSFGAAPAPGWRGAVALSVHPP